MKTVPANTPVVYVVAITLDNETEVVRIYNNRQAASDHCKKHNEQNPCYFGKARWSAWHVHSENQKTDTVRREQQEQNR